MSRSTIHTPERWLDAGATAFERRLLEADAHEEPSPELSARMAQGLGISGAAITAIAVAKAASADIAAAKVATGAAGVAVWPWISVGVLGLVVAGVIVGTHGSTTSERQASPVSRPVSAPVPVAAPPSGLAEPAATVVEPPPGPTAPGRRGRAGTIASDLRDQIAMVDAARAALLADSGERVLQILRRYQDRYPVGSFRPEATALKIEALVQLGRQGEARTLARRFVAENAGTALADRVANVAGLTQP
jgi:hypothetical protein